MRRIRVLVVEDSLVERTLLVSILSTDQEIEVLGAVKSGSAALAFLEGQKPDVITMDTTMPGMDGYEATRKIMETTPVPIIMVGESWNPEEVDATFRAVEAGAVAELAKPTGIGSPSYEDAAQRFIQTVKAMAEVKVVRRWSRNRRFVPGVDGASGEGGEVNQRHDSGEIHLVAIGSSTGGPAVLQTILANLRKEFSPPVVITQHIAPGFLEGLVKWLGQTTGRAIHIAGQRERLLPGHIYLAPDGFHMGLEQPGTIVLSKEAPEHGMRPAVSHLFRSVINAFGRKAVGVLLTGMGRDGAEELKQMRDGGSLTIAQDQETSVVFGMPGEAIRLGGAVHVLPPEKIAAMLNEIVDCRQRATSLVRYGG
jgi:two-component system chemotaxis response regulator CheB